MRTYLAAITGAALLLLGGCGGNVARQDMDNPGTALRGSTAVEAVVLDALGQPAPDLPQVQLAPVTDRGALQEAAYTLAAGGESSGGSLYLELLSDASQGVPQVALAPELSERALLFVKPLEPGRTDVGVAMLGKSQQLPGGGEILRINLGERAQVAHTGGVRVASAAPVVPVRDLHFHATQVYRLFWTSYNCGDYDQNGQVTIGDITPVGVRFGSVKADPDWNSERVADGDGNGEVGISDLTPIGLNYNSGISEFHVLESDSEDGTFSPVAGGTVEFESQAKPQSGGPRNFNFLLDSPTFGHYYAVEASDGENTTGLSNVAQFAPDNFPPIVNVTRTGGAEEQPGIQIYFDATMSMDPDGTIATYEWDPYGDGDWKSTGLATYVNTYTRLGTFTPRVRLTDNDGLPATVSLDPLTIRIGNPVTKTIYSGGEARERMSASNLPDGRPAVVFTEKYTDMFTMPTIVRATAADAQTWEAPALALTSYENCDQFSLLAQGVYFRMMYQIQDSLHLEEFKDNGAGPPNGSSLIHNDDFSPVGLQISAIPTSSNTAAAYLKAGSSPGTGQLYYVSFADGYTPHAVNYQDCANPSLAFVNFGAAIAYTRVINETTHDLYFQRQNFQPTIQFDPAVSVVVDKDVETAERCIVPVYNSASLEMVVVYWSATDNALYSITAEDYSGTSWRDPVVIDSDCDPGSRYSLRLVQNLPCVVYPDGTELKYAVAGDYTAGSWNSPIVVADADGGFGETDLLFAGGKPVIFYIDETDHNVRAVTFE